MAETVRNNLADTINELNKLLLLTQNPTEEDKIRKLRKIYFTMFEEVIEQQLDNTTADFTAAVEGLKKAKEAALQARENIAKIAQAIDSATRAVKLVDKVVNIGLTLFG